MAVHIHATQLRKRRAQCSRHDVVFCPGIRHILYLGFSVRLGTEAAALLLYKIVEVHMQWEERSCVPNMERPEQSRRRLSRTAVHAQSISKDTSRDQVPPIVQVPPVTCLRCIFTLLVLHNSLGTSRVSKMWPAKLLTLPHITGHQTARGRAT